MMTIEEAVRRIEDLINEFPDEIYIAALEEMEERAMTARQAKEAELQALDDNQDEELAGD